MCMWWVEPREQRPCVYPGRVLLKVGSAPSVWLNSDLLRVGRTEPVQMLPARDMLAIEDIGHEVSPPTTEDGENFPLQCHELSSCLCPTL